MYPFDGLRSTSDSSCYLRITIFYIHRHLEISVGSGRCHHWQRPLPIMSSPAANLKSMPLFPLRCLPLPVCRAPNLLDAPHFARHQQCSSACHLSLFAFHLRLFFSVCRISAQQTGRAWKAQRKCPNDSIFVFCSNHKDFDERLNIAK